MRKLFLIVSGLYLAASVMAADFPYLLFRQVDGSEKMIKSQGLHVKVTEGKFVVDHVDGKDEFLLSQLTSMTFVDEFGNLLSGMGELSDFMYSTVEVYDGTGKFVGKFESADRAVGFMEKGSVYVIRNDEGTVKKIIIK